MLVITTEIMLKHLSKSCSCREFGHAQNFQNMFVCVQWVQDTSTL